MAGARCSGPFLHPPTIPSRGLRAGDQEEVLSAERTSHSVEGTQPCGARHRHARAAGPASGGKCTPLSLCVHGCR